MNQQLYLGSGSAFLNGKRDCVNSSFIHHWNGVAAPFAIVSSVLSIFGSSLIIITYLVWKDVRKSIARAILFFLALADLLSASGYLVSAVTYYAGNQRFSFEFCKYAGVWTTYFPMASYIWTSHFAIYYFVVLVLKKEKWRIKMMIAFQFTAWLIPLIILIPADVTGWIGRGRYTLSGPWCFISDKNFHNQSVDNFKQLSSVYLTMEAICGKFWELMAYISGLVSYGLIICCNRCRWQKHLHLNSYASRRISEAMAKTDFKLLLVPFVFMFIKVWGVIRYISALLPNCRLHYINETTSRLVGLCIREDCQFSVYNPFLVIMQATCDPLQGFCNAVLFVFLSKMLCTRISIASWKLMRSVYCYMCTSHKIRKSIPVQIQTEDKHPLVYKWKAKGYIKDNRHHCDDK